MKMIRQILIIPFIFTNLVALESDQHPLPSLELSSSHKQADESQWTVDFQSDWAKATFSQKNTVSQKANDWGGIIDLMGNGALMLEKTNSDNLYTHVSDFKNSGNWISNWHTFDSEVELRSIKTNIIAYGQQINMRKGWVKFSGNPILSGENTLLPLNTDNITEQTILLPKPGGVPQDQAIVRGRGTWEGKWVLFYNHTPNAWPNDYYWSAAVADNLYPMKEGINPFTIDMLYYPLFGPIDNHAPNDWLEIDGVTYAPDENHEGFSHMWKSTDMITWVDLGPISGINGSDPGMIFDGKDYYLFNESNNQINYNKLSTDFVNVVEGGSVLEVGDHTGDADLGFFNNQWYMFFDDGPHLHYNIGCAVTSAEEFPYGWKLENDIYGPHNPEQGQQWDDDSPKGNDFGTGDADIALEGSTLYMFTERPIGAAYKELSELWSSDDIKITIMIEVDKNEDGVADESTGWYELSAGEKVWQWSQELTGKRFRIHFRMETFDSRKSPLIQMFTLNCKTIESEN